MNIPSAKEMGAVSAFYGKVDMTDMKLMSNEEQQLLVLLDEISSVSRRGKITCSLNMDLDESVIKKLKENGYIIGASEKTVRIIWDPVILESLENMDNAKPKREPIECISVVDEKEATFISRNSYRNNMHFSKGDIDEESIENLSNVMIDILSCAKRRESFFESPTAVLSGTVEILQMLGYLVLTEDDVTTIYWGESKYLKEVDLAERRRAGVK